MASEDRETDNMTEAMQKEDPTNIVHYTNTLLTFTRLVKISGRVNLESIGDGACASGGQETDFVLKRKTSK